MKLADYKQDDIEAVLEFKKAALDHIAEIEKAIWTDDMSAATGSTLKLYESLQRVRVKKQIKKDEQNMRFLAEELIKKGVKISIMPIKKADQRFQR